MGERVPPNPIGVPSEEAGVGCEIQRFEHGRGALLPGSAEELGIEIAADDRGKVQQLSHRIRKAPEPAGHHLPHSVRNPKRTQVNGGSTPGVHRHGVGLDHVPKKLLEEERIAIRLLMQRSDQRHRDLETGDAA